MTEQELVGLGEDDVLLAGLSKVAKALAPESTKDPSEVLLETLSDEALFVRRHARKTLREDLGIEVYGPEDNKGRRKPLPAADIAEQIRCLLHFKGVWADDQKVGLYVYHGGVYQPTKQVLTRLCRAILPGSASTMNYVNEIIGYLIELNGSDLADFDKDAEDGWVNLQNGWINVYTRTRREHSPEYLSLKQLPVPYVSGATCPTIDALIRQWVDDKYVLTLYENIAHCLITGDYPIQSVIVLIGHGQNGKSTYLKLVTAFLGQANVSGIELQSFGVNRFASARLVGKMANICADMDKKRFTNTAEFKKLTGDDLIQAEIKHGALFTFYNYAKFMVSVNELPPSPDDSDAFHRRIARIVFGRKFSGKERKKMRDLIVAATKEFPGLLNKCLDILPALLDRQHFDSDSDDVDVKREAYKRASDAIYGFWEDHIDYGVNDDGTEKSKLYRLYADYCDKNEIPTLKMDTFFRNLKGEMIRRGLEYLTHQVGPENDRGPRLLKGVKHIAKKTEENPEHLVKPERT